MTEIPDTFRGGEDAEIEMPKASRGRSMGRGFAPPHLTRGSGGALQAPRRGLGQRPGQKWIWYVLSSTEHISDRQKCQNDQLHFNQQQHIFGIGTIQHPEWPRIFSGQAHKICDCPKKFGMDGHLMRITILQQVTTHNIIHGERQLRLTNKQRKWRIKPKTYDSYIIQLI